MRKKKHPSFRLVEAPVGEMVLRYQSSGEGLREIIERLSPAVYRYPSGKAYSQEDDSVYTFFQPLPPSVIFCYIFISKRFSFPTFPQALSRFVRFLV
jgi:hypothetical protein